MDRVSKITPPPSAVSKKQAINSFLNASQYKTPLQISLLKQRSEGRAEGGRESMGCESHVPFCPVTNSFSCPRWGFVKGLKQILQCKSATLVAVCNCNGARAFQKARQQPCSAVQTDVEFLNPTEK